MFTFIHIELDEFIKRGGKISYVPEGYRFEFVNGWVFQSAADDEVREGLYQMEVALLNQIYDEKSRVETENDAS